MINVITYDGIEMYEVKIELNGYEHTVFVDKEIADLSDDHEAFVMQEVKDYIKTVRSAVNDN